VTIPSLHSQQPVSSDSIDAYGSHALLVVAKLKSVPLFSHVRTSLLQDLIALLNLLDIDGLWESCVSKHIDVQKIEQSNEILKEAGTYMRKERGVVPVIE
jgi:hypothetical protein